MPGFELFVDDNYHYMDEESRYRAGSFASYDEALARAKAIVDEFLEDAHRPGMTSSELYQGYVGFGEDPFIVPSGDPRFSAWEYARMRCAELCRDEDAVASVLRYSSWPPELQGFVAVLGAVLARHDLGAAERAAVDAFRLGVECYPNALPSGSDSRWLRLEHAGSAFTAYLYADRVKLSASGVPVAPVDWEVRFYGTGRCDRREGDAAAALAAMAEAAQDPLFTLRART